MAKRNGTKKRILVIEDELVLGRLCQRVLTAAGYAVDLAASGLTAREKAAAQPYDLCVSDIRLPGLTGMQLYEQWRESGHPLAERIIFITGDTLNNTVQGFLEKVGRPYLMKPFDLQELVAAVERALAPVGLTR